MRGWMTAHAFAMVLVGCKFPELPPVLEDAAYTDASSIDAEAVDAEAVDAMTDPPPPCSASTIECNDATNVYTECSAEGVVTRQFNCPLGCAPDEKCFEVAPRNGLASYVDMVRERNDLPTVTFTGMSRVQTDDGVVFNGPNTIVVPSVPLAGVGRVFLFEQVTISGIMDVDGASAMVIVADGDVIIDGTLDISAEGASSGPGARFSGPCAGGAAVGTLPTPGGGGGGRHMRGGDGGRDGGGELGGGGGPQVVDESLEPLEGGCVGGASADLTQHVSSGGGGGGAVHIVSRSRIVIMGQGKLDASGGGGGLGVDTDNLAGGGGGGSGGGIFLEAPEVILDGSGVVLSTKGGSGAAPGDAPTAPGQDGGTSVGAAPGGTAAGQPSGGSGGIINTPPTPGGNGTGSGSGAGGGGASGVTQIRTRTGAINPQGGAVILSYASIYTLGTRVVP